MRLFIHDAEEHAPSPRRKNSHSLKMVAYRGANNRRASLRLASELLKKKKLGLCNFLAAVDGILWAARDHKTWITLVENAYSRLISSRQKRARFVMLVFFGHAGKYERVLEFLPRRYNLMELAFALVAFTELKRFAEAESLLSRCRLGIKTADHKEMSVWLADCLSTYHAKRNEWERSL